MRYRNWLLNSAAACAIAVGANFTPGSARAADLPVKAPPLGCTQAVDGINGKLAGLGGSFADKSVGAAIGSLSMPLGCEWGAQVDATGGTFDRRFLGAVAGHLFWRDPTKALLGVYGSYTYWDQAGGVSIGHFGPEGELYLGRWTLAGVGGVESGNNTSAVIGGVTQTYNIKTRFFDELNVAYYLTDNFEAYVGHRYLGGKNALAVGGEYGIPLSHGIMASLFAEGRIGEDNDHGIWGGVRFYFGQTDKTLIRRHREDDPPDWDNGIDGTPNTGVSSPSENGPF